MNETYEAPKLTQREILDTFMPECLPAIKKNIFSLKKQFKELDKVCSGWFDRTLEKIYTDDTIPEHAKEAFWVKNARWFCYDRVIDPITDKIKELEQLLRLSNIKDAGNDIYSDLARAKKYPIKDLLRLNHASFATCPFHVDHTPSLKVDRKNRCHCFSCGFDGDVIDLYQKMNNVDFKTALTILTK